MTGRVARTNRIVNSERTSAISSSAPMISHTMVPALMPSLVLRRGTRIISSVGTYATLIADTVTSEYDLRLVAGNYA